MTAFVMEAHILHTFSTPHAQKRWFKHAWPHVIKDKERQLIQRYISLPTPDNHDLHISARNRVISQRGNVRKKKQPT